MNNIYKTIWNKSKGTWVVVSEHAAAHGKRSGRSEKKQTAAAMLLLASTIGLTLASSAAQAVTSWNLPSGDWAVGANWTSGVPTSAQQTLISNGGTAILGFSSATTGATAQLIVGNTAATTGGLTIQNGSTLTTTNAGAIVGNAATSNGTVTVTGTSSRWTDAGSLIIGASGTGALNITSAGTVTDTAGTIGQNAGSNGTVNVNAGTWTNSSTLTVGSAGTGSLTVQNGGIVTNTTGTVGSAATGNGTVTVTGTSSRWTNSGGLTVATSGTGVLTVANGGTVTNTSGTIGQNAGSTGTVNVNAGTWTNSSSVVVGSAGTGTLNIQNGGTATTTGLSIIGNSSGSTGLVSVVGSNSSLTSTSWTIVGNAGTGTLNISDGARVAATGSTAQVYIAGTSASVGTVTLNGAGSSLSANSFIQVGAVGTGTLTITNGATATSNMALLGNASTAVGTVTIDGIGSSWTVANSNPFFWEGLAVARDGVGTLTVQNGGALISNSSVVGNGSTGVGTVTITGTGSRWVDQSTIYVGYQGTGTLTVEDGGAVASVDVIAGNTSTGTGTVTVTGSDSSLTASNSLTVGNAGTGTLSIADGATVSGGSVITLGNASTGDGTVAVDGSGSALTIANNLVIGEAGSGTLTVTDGAMLKSGLSIIGDAATGVGAVTIDGAGSTWDDTGDPIVGNAGVGTLTISNGGTLLSTVSVLGNLATGNGTVTVTDAGSTWTDTSTITVGNAGTGLLTITDSGSVTAAGGVLVATQAGSTGTVVLSNAGILQTPSLTEGAGTGTVNFNGGILRATTNNASFISGFDAGDLNILAGGATIDDAGFTIATNNIFSGTGALTKIGSGMLTLNGISTYTGGTTVSAGTLAVGDASNTSAALSGGGAVSVASGATLGGYGSVTGTVTNNGTIASANAMSAFSGNANGNFTINGTLLNSGLAQIGGTGIGNSLTVNSYVGNGGSTVGLNTFLGTDGSPSDLLVIDGGTTTGSSGLTITNIGGGGALTTGNGIKVIDAINGGTTTSGTFALSSRAVAGPYEYTLFRGSVDGSDAQDWYLRSTLPLSQPGSGTPNYRQEVSLYTALPSMAQTYGRTLLGTMHERVGELEQLRNNSALDPNRTENNGVWGRVVGVRGSQGDGSIYSDDPKFDYDVTALQIGSELYREAHDDGRRDHAGIYGAIGHLSGDVTHADGNKAGKSSFDAYTLGLYGTHFGASGWYVDSVAQATWYDNVNAQSSRTQGTASKIGLSTRGYGVAASVEVGYPLQIGRGWIVEPQAQLVYQRIEMNDSSDIAAKVDFSTAESVVGRMGGRLARTWSQDKGDNPRHVTGWLSANLWHEFAGNNKTGFSSANGDVPFRSDLGGSWTDVGSGFSAQLTHKTTVFAHVNYLDGVDNDRHAYSGKLGLRINW